MQRQHSNVPDASIYSESGISCNSRINKSTSLSHATKTIGHGTKKQKAKRKHSNVIPSRKRNLSANEELEKLTEISRNNTEKSYFTTENKMPEGLKFVAFFYRLLKAHQLTSHTLTYQSVLSLIHLFQIHKTHQLNVAVSRQMRKTMLFYNKPLTLLVINTSRFQTMGLILTMKQHVVDNSISKNHLRKI